MPYRTTLQEMVALATEGIRFQTWPFSLDLLPVEGLLDAASTIGATRGALMSTLTILDGIRKGPYGLPSTLQQLLSNIRFHVVNGITLIDANTSLGHTPYEPRLVVEGLQSALDNQVLAITRAREVWVTWLTDAYASKAQGDVLPPPPIQADAFSGYGTDVPPATAPGQVTCNGCLFVGAVIVGVLYYLSR